MAVAFLDFPDRIGAFTGVTRLITTVALLLAICVALPVIANLVQAAVPPLSFCLIGLFVLWALQRRARRGGW
jgi:hypothetical protein